MSHVLIGGAAVRSSGSIKIPGKLYEIFGRLTRLFFVFLFPFFFWLLCGKRLGNTEQIYI